MKGKISIAGALYIERNGVLKPVFCPFMTNGGCNDNCALFGEPLSGGSLEYSTELSLCNKTLYFCGFNDERKWRDYEK